MTKQQALKVLKLAQRAEKAANLARIEAQKALRNGSTVEAYQASSDASGAWVRAINARKAAQEQYDAA